MSNRKVLYLITGPIGVGKTTYAKAMIDYFSLKKIEYISADIYYYLFFRDNTISDNINYFRAKAFCDYKLKKAVSNDHSFVWETVVAKKEKMAFLEKCVHAGYVLFGAYIGIDGHAKLLERIQKRHSEGWYDIPLAKVSDRYNKVMENMAKICDLSTVFIAIDVTENTGRLVYYKNNMTADLLCTDTCTWIAKYLTSASKDMHCDDSLF